MVFPFAKRLNLIMLVSIGVFAGLFAIVTAGLSTKWLVANMAAVFLIFLAVIIKDVKNYFLACFVFILPLNISKTLGGVKDVIVDGVIVLPIQPPFIQIYVTDIMLFALFFIWFVERVVLRKDKQKIKISATLVPLVFLLLWSLFSFVKARSVALSFYGFLGLLNYFLVYFYFVNNMRTKTQLKIVIIFLVLGALLQGMITFAQWKLGISVDVLSKSHVEEGVTSIEENINYRADDLFRASGTVGVSNIQALYFEMVMPLILSLFLTEPRIHKKIFLFLCYITSAVGVILTFSKAGWGILLVTTGIVLVLLSRRKYLDWRVVTGILLIGVILCSLTIPFVLTKKTIDYDKSLVTRFSMYNLAVRMIKSDPFLGVGLNNSTAVQWQDRYDSDWARIAYLGNKIVPIHNFYFILAVEVGLVGLGLFLWFVFRGIKEGVRLVRGRDEYPVPLAIGLITGIIGFLIHSFVDICGFKIHLTLLFMYVGILSSSSITSNLLKNEN